MDDGPVKTPTPWAGQVKGWFRNQAPAGERVPASEHLTHGARENEQLAEIIGQLQHLLDLADDQIGRPRYLPLIADLSGITSQTVYPPAGHVAIAQLIVSGANAGVVWTVTMAAPSLPGGSAVIAKVYGNAPGGVPLDVDIPIDCTALTITVSASGSSAFAMFVFRPVRPGSGGGYPNVQ